MMMPRAGFESGWGGGVEPPQDSTCTKSSIAAQKHRNAELCKLRVTLYRILETVRLRVSTIITHRVTLFKTRKKAKTPRARMPTVKKGMSARI